jgi:protein-disulfide isomerase
MPKRNSGVFMSRLAIGLALVAGLLGGGLAASLTLRPEPFDEARVRAIAAEAVAAAPTLDRPAIETIVREALASRPTGAASQAPQSVAGLDAGTLNPMIEDYLLKNPRILERAQAALSAEIRAAEAAAQSAALAELQTVLYDDPDAIVVGNPQGDVTLIEMFDYNCTYCRQALPDLVALIEEDPNLKIILREFPILSQGSIDAAKVATVVADADVDYWTFHQAVYSSRGQVTKESALAAAEALGLNPLTVQIEMESPSIQASLDKSYEIARKLDISGTPTFILGEEIIPGAIGLDAMRQRIANMRACGATTCPAPAAPAT